MAQYAIKLESTSATTDESLSALIVAYKNNIGTAFNAVGTPEYIVAITNDIQSDLQPKVYTIYICYIGKSSLAHKPALFNTYIMTRSRSILPEIDRLHDSIVKGNPIARVVKEIGNYDKWFETAKDEIEKQTKLIVTIPASSNENKKKKHIADLRNMLKPSKEKKSIKQIKTMSNSLKEVSVIYINSNDYDKQMKKIEEMLNGKEDSIDIVQYNGRGWMGAHHGNKICWLKDFVDYMDFNTFISFIDPYRREFSNDGTHFMNDYSLFIINSFIPFNKLFGSLINEEQRALLNKRIITKFELDN